MQRNANPNDKPDFDKGGGLIPAVVQDADTGEVLMLGYMNEASLAKTREIGRVTFFSRSRSELWTKGETSGNFLEFVDVHLDCDRDTLLVLARPLGATCHRGTQTCFGDRWRPEMSFLGRLDKIIATRLVERPNESYTTRLLDAGTKRIAQKVGEEGVETALAAVAEDDDGLLDEASDLLYHLMVLLRARNLSLEDLSRRLASRHS